MTTLFVSAVDGNNADNGTTWALAKQTVQGALTIAVTGDVIVVDNAGSFTANAAIAWTGPTSSNVAIISVTRSGTVSFTWGAGATESVGASSSAFIIAGCSGGALYIYGMTINGGTNNNAACNIQLRDNGATSFNAAKLYLDTCTLDLPTANDRTILIASTNNAAASSAGATKLVNCTFKRSNAANVTQYFDMGMGALEIINPTFTLTGGITGQLVGFQSTTVVSATVIIRDGDISGYNTSGGALVAVNPQTLIHVLFENLKLGSNIVITAQTWQAGDMDVTVRNCDSGNTTYVFDYINPYGTLTVDTSIYITSGGAVFNGAGASWKIVTTSLCSEYTPFITPGLFIWDTTLTAQTASVEIIRDNATALTNRDIWSDLDSAASASFPNYTYQTNRNANPFTGTPANQTTSTATWTGTGGFSNPTKQKLQNAFTAAATGLLQSRVSVGVASTTFYVDPFIGGVT